MKSSFSSNISSEPQIRFSSALLIHKKLMNFTWKHAAIVHDLPFLVSYIYLFFNLFLFGFHNFI